MKNEFERRAIMTWCFLCIVAVALTFAPVGSASGYQGEDSNLTASETKLQDERPDLSSFKPMELTEPPERKLPVKELTEVQTVRPPVLSSTLLEKKYVAVLELPVPKLTKAQRAHVNKLVNQDSQNGRDYRSYSNRGIAVARIDGRRSDLVAVRKFSVQNPFGLTSTSDDLSTLRGYFEELLKDVPEARRPADSSLDFLFLSLESGLYTGEIYVKSPETPEDYLIGIKLYVVSPQEADSVGNALLTLFDYGLTYNTQKMQLERWQTKWEEWESLPQTLAAAESTLSKHQEDLAKLEPIPGNVIESIKQRRYNLDVDLQGVEARNDAIREALKTDPAGTVLTRLFELRIEAQIDLRGLMAQRDKLNEMIQTFDASERLKENIRRASSELRNLKNRIQALPVELELYRIAGDFVQPLEVQNNEIRLYPVQWGDAPADRSRQ